METDVDLNQKVIKHVKFDSKITYIYDDEKYLQCLLDYRKSDVMQRKADRDRYLRLLSPILDLKHREKIQKMLTKYE